MKIFLILLLLCSASFNNARGEDISNYLITAKKLDHARNNLSTSTGSSSYIFNQEDIHNLPQGDNSSLGSALLQAPGVVQNSFGKFHIRDDHSNLQYRINGIIIPEAIGGFGQILDMHIIDKMTLLTGALPAEYGYRTAGVIDIKTKTGGQKVSGRSEITNGSHNIIGLNQQFSGAKEKFSYYLSGSFLQNDLGIEAPTAAANPIHDQTKQDKEFGYFTYLLDDQTRLSAIVSNAHNNFQIPNNPNQAAAFTLNGVENISSSNLNEKQSEASRYAILALQGIIADLDLDYQLAAFSSYTNLRYKPDYYGDLVFNGSASNIANNNLTNGLQGDFSYVLNENNILRSGFFVSESISKSERNTAVFAADDAGTQTSSDPFSIADESKINSENYGIYLQNEWAAFSDLTINYGARFDMTRSYINASQLSPRLGAVYVVSPKTTFHAGYARYFTPPPTEILSANTVALFANTTNASENLTNDKIKPERTNYYDLGVMHKLTDHINLGLDGYYKDVSDLLDEGQFGTALIYTPFNYQKAKIYGAEFTANYKNGDLSGYFNFSAQNAKAKNIISGQYLIENDELNYVANHYVHLDHDQTYSASAGASYKFYKTNYNLNTIYGSGLRRGFANSDHLPSYTQINIGANRDFDLPIIAKTNIRLAVINLFDKTYRISDGSGIGISASRYGTRRAYYITMSKDF